jgi:ankyrin repeat protein
MLQITLWFSMTVAAQSGDIDRQLIDAADRGDVAAIRELLDQGAALEATDSGHRTALMVATQGNHVQAARLLIEAGADVNAKDNIQDSPYLLAGASGYLEILKLTLAHGADLKSTNRYGGTALIPACERGHVDTVRELLTTAIDVNHVNKLGWTALLEAIILSDGGPQHIAIVDMLIKAGADVTLADNEDVTPLQHARQRGYREIERILLQAGSN